MSVESADARIRGIAKTLVGHEGLSLAVKAQLGAFVDLWRRHLGNDLTGVYLHGSIALGAYRQGVGDVDLLVVLQRRLSREERLAIARDVLTIDARPSSLEFSALWRGHLTPWRHPAHCQFHYSLAWTQRYEKMLAGEIGAHPLLDEDFADPDIACHARLTRQSGLCLWGAPVGEAIPEVPEADFWHSISADVQDFDFLAYGAAFLPATVLGLGRVLSYPACGRILSKFEAGLWMMQALPRRFAPLAQGALLGWYDGAPFAPREEELRDFAAYIKLHAGWGFSRDCVP